MLCVLEFDRSYSSGNDQFNGNSRNEIRSNSGRGRFNRRRSRGRGNPRTGDFESMQEWSHEKNKDNYSNTKLMLITYHS